MQSIHRHPRTAYSGVQLSLISAADRDSARRAYRLFARTPEHNSLRFKKLAGYADLWADMNQNCGLLISGKLSE
jgi:hypothetical protein